MTSPVRSSFLEATRVARDVLADPSVALRWDTPSALTGFSLGGLCGHLARACMVVADYLDAPDPGGSSPVDAAGYFAGFPSPDANPDLHASIRRRGEEAAAGGHQALLASLDGARCRLSELLASEPAGRTVRVAGGVVLLLDDYLQTRLVELALHTDDVCVSVGLPTPVVPGAETAINLLVEVARARHGDAVVLRALGRRERDPHDALRVF